MKYMESRDKAYIRTLGETGGLGTVATRADIIDKLFKSFLMEKKGKDIYITSKARQLLRPGAGGSEKAGADGFLGTEAWKDRQRRTEAGSLSFQYPGLYRRS